MFRYLWYCSSHCTSTTWCISSSEFSSDFKGMKGYLQNQFPIPSFPALTGFDVAGVVVAVGDGVTRLQVGNAVWASLPTQQGGKPLVMGAYAQYAVIPEAKVGLAPSNLNPLELASMPVVAITGLQALQSLGVKQGDKVLVVGGSGGTGSCAIQIAKRLGAHVTTTCSKKNMDFCKATDVDGVYDCIGETGICSKSNKVLKDGGKFVSIAAWADFFQHKWERGVSGTMLQMDSTNAKTLETLQDMFENGEIKAATTKVFKLENIVDALKEGAKGHTVGKIVIEID
uniref:Enoyl reductase (ER) domain-containing protein n=1 Tax=Lotharella oceanica TaxID=641309 RepID=A0A7S2XH75_9EUKA|mmetsp:Transcript_8829/g.17294  ORF Transcript_8829/g.17294 Transcript_8829/m.17294 type:complete len:285 (+) Transcript_8829:13-867(+)